MVKIQSYHLSKGIKNLARHYEAFVAPKPCLIGMQLEKTTRFETKKIALKKALFHNT